MLNQNSKQAVDYFQRGKVLFLVDGNEWDDATSPQQVVNWATQVTAEKGLTLDNFRSVTFRSVDDLLGGGQGTPGTEEPEEPQEPPPIDVVGPVLSLKKSEGKRPYTSPIVEEQGRFVLVSADVPELKDIPAEDDPAQVAKLKRDASRLLNLIRSLDEIRGTFPVGILQVVSPNWLTSGTKDSIPGGTGGPGARPRRFDETQANLTLDKYRFHLHGVSLDFYNSVEQGKRGEGVVVAILDTAPKADGLSPDPGKQWVEQVATDPASILYKIHDQWVTQRISQNNDPHSLIDRLLNHDEPRLTVHIHRDVDQPIPNIGPAGFVQAIGHDYEMTSHGLFIAGIINTLAPQAELHLYQVLNRFGVGNLASIADALQEVYERFVDQPLVVNLSLTINIPLVKQHSQDDDDDDMGRSLLASREEEENDENSWSKRQDLAAKRICELALAIGKRVIAAAGNNRKEAKQPGRPQACYPAALDSVLGVGALPRINKPPSDPAERLKTTSYSNLSDRPNGTGITTLGGEEGKRKGILGIFIDKIPSRDPNSTEPGDDDSDDNGPDNDGPDDRAARETNPPNGWGWWAGTSFATPIISGITAAVLSNLPDESKTEDAIVELFGAQSFETEDSEDVLFVTQGPPTPSPPSF